jgi:hypothetical protein
MTGRFALYGNDGSQQLLELTGREEWALSQLLAAGSAGCTPIDQPGPRWSDYVFKLRRRGIDIETVTETHEGPYAGHHARYVPRSGVLRLADGESAAPSYVQRDVALTDGQVGST